MINVLLPSMGSSIFFKDSFFPKHMIEIAGKTMLEQVVDNYCMLKDANYIFVFAEKECREFHMDDSVKILVPTSKVIKLKNQTAGALCTCLMAIELINDNAPLIIANSDQIIDVNYKDVIAHFSAIEADAGVITFSSIHPRWSYAKENEDEILEVAEKRPVSRHAIAGFYYFAQGKYFVEAAKEAILKRNQHDGRYFISASINELILRGKKIGYYHIDKKQYHSFYSPAKISEYEEGLKR